MQATSYAFMVAYQYVFHSINEHRLWFDVGIEEYTTVVPLRIASVSVSLLQN